MGLSDKGTLVAPRSPKGIIDPIRPGKPRRNDPYFGEAQ